MDKVKVVAHCANPFLPITMFWLYEQIRSVREYQAVVVTQALLNQDSFPMERVISTENLSWWSQFGYRMAQKVLDRYAGYEPMLEQSQANVVHAHFGQEGYRCSKACGSIGVPMVTSFYGLDVSMLPRQPGWKQRFDRLFSEGARFLAEGRHLASELEALGCPPEKISLQHFGVDVDRLNFKSVDSRPAENPVVLMYASLREKKGILYGLQAFHRIHATVPSAKIRLIGDGPMRGEVEAEIRRLNLADKVTLLGYLPHDRCVEELSRAAVLLYPSVTASDGDTEGGAPVGLIEAMAVGLPIVSSVHADIPEVVPDGCGLLFLERDVEGLADGLRVLLDSPELRSEMGLAGRSHVELNHNLMVQGEKLGKIYDEVVEEYK